MIVIMIRLALRRVRSAGDPRSLIRQWQQGPAFRIAGSAGLLAQEKDDEGENQAEADRDGEGNDREGQDVHGLRGGGGATWAPRTA